MIDRRKWMATALASALVAVPTWGVAQPGDERESHRKQPQTQQQAAKPQHKKQEPQQDRRKAGNQQPKKAEPARKATRPVEKKAETRRGAGPQRNLHSGDRLPQNHRRPQYVVDDWRGHKLPPPGRGQQWVQVGADYVLIAIATGIIASVVLGH